MALHGHHHSRRQMMRRLMAPPAVRVELALPFIQRFLLRGLSRVSFRACTLRLDDGAVEEDCGYQDQKSRTAILSPAHRTSPGPTGIKSRYVTPTVHTFSFPPPA